MHKGLLFTAALIGLGLFLASKNMIPGIDFAKVPPKAA
jgi:hypothetical protein